MTGERQMLLQSLKRAKGRLQVITDQYHALTSITCKVLERVICYHIWEHLENHNMLTDFQHGFRKRRNSETQVISHYRI